MKTHGIMVGLGMVAIGGCAADVAATEAALPATTDEQGGIEQAWDPFAGEMPDLLADAHRELLGGEISIPTMQRLYDYATETGDDARPWLLLAHDSMARGWPGFAVRQYRAAFEADPRVTQYERVLSDLVWTAMNLGSVEYTESVDLIVEAWGEEALSMIDDVMLTLHEEGDLERARKLAEIRAAITGGEAPAAP